jgi:hypothetical protein
VLQENCRAAWPRTDSQQAAFLKITLKIIAINFLVAERQLQSSLTWEDSKGAAVVIANIVCTLQLNPSS